MVELSRTTQTDLKSIRESLSHQLSDVEHKLANSQQRIEDCLVEMNTKTTTNFETTKEESSDSIGVVETKLANLTVKVVDNFFNANCLLKCMFTAIRQSIKSLVFNLRDKLVANQERMEKKLDNLIAICRDTHQFSDTEFVNVKHALTQANRHFDEISKRLDEMMAKIADLEEKHHVQIEKELEIEHISLETREKLGEQKLVLDEIARFKFPSLPQPVVPPSPPPPPPPPKKEVDDGIKRTIRRFDQPTLSQISKTTKGKLNVPAPHTSTSSMSPAVSSSSLSTASHGQATASAAAAAAASTSKTKPDSSAKKTDQSSTLSSHHSPEGKE